MDPNELLKQLYEQAQFIIEQTEKEYPDVDITDADARELAEKFVNLHSWITNGGFLPKEWKDREPEALVHMSKNQPQAVYLYPRNMLTGEDMQRPKDLASHYLQHVVELDPTPVRSLEDILFGIRSLNGEV